MLSFSTHAEDHSSFGFQRLVLESLGPVHDFQRMERAAYTNLNRRSRAGKDTGKRRLSGWTGFGNGPFPLNELLVQAVSKILLFMIEVYRLAWIFFNVIQVNGRMVED